MIQIKRTISALLFAALLITTVNTGAFAAAKSRFVFSKSFESESTNSVPDGITVTGGKARVVELSSKNKALEILGEGAEMSMPLTDTEDKYSFGMELMSESKMNAEINLYIGNTKVELIKIAGNNVKTAEGKQVSSGLTNGMFCGVQVSINRKTGRYSLYINGKLVLCDWKLSRNGAFTKVVFKKSNDMPETIVADNLFVINSTELQRNIPKEIFSSKGEEFINFTDDLGDLTFFSSDYAGQDKKYLNATFINKTNEIVCEKYDYKNPDKGDRIILKKFTSDDVYFDMAAKIPTGYISDRRYKYFKLTGDFMADITGSADISLFMLRDTETTGSQINMYPITISNGDISINGGAVVKGVAKGKKWFNLTLYLDMNKQTFDVLIDGETVAENLAVKAELKVLNMTRISINSGEAKGELQMRHVEVTGLDKPYEGEEIRTSMFEGDAGIEEDMKSRVAFNYYGKTIAAYGEKSAMNTEPILENNILYIGIDDFNRAYGTALTTDGKGARLGEKTVTFKNIPKKAANQWLIPVAEAAETLLGMYSFADNDGMVITSKEKIYFNLEDEVPYYLRQVTTGKIDKLTNLQYVYDYVLFDRPKSNELLEGYNKRAEELGAAHPMLMATRSDFEDLKKQAETDPDLKRIVDNLIKEADNELKKDTISYKYDDSMRTLNTAKLIESRMMLLGFAYQMTGDQKYGDFAWQNLEALNRFPDFNLCHPIDAGSYGAGLAIGYDWLYDCYTEQQRANIRENAKRLHIEPISNSFYGRTPAKQSGSSGASINMMGIYAKWISNYNIWANYGNAMMSIAFMDTYPELCSDFLEKTIRSAEYTFKNLYPSGVWIESANYWTIVATGMNYIFGSLDTVYGTDFNLSRFPGTEETGIVKMSLVSQGGNYNYHDAQPRTEWAEFPMSFLGKYFNQPELSAARQMYLFNRNSDSGKMNIANPMDALYYVKVDESDINKLPRAFYAKGLESFAVHTDYSDKNALYFAAQGGPTTFYHSHYDCGDFIFEYKGTRWADALGLEDYNSGIADNEKYRWRPEGHNTLVINNDSDIGQLKNTFAPLIDYAEGGNGAYVVYDLSEVYRDVESAKRGFMIGDGYTSLTIRDEITLKDDNKDNEIYWFMHTQADIHKVDHKTVILSSNGESMTLTFDTDATTSELSIMDAKPLSSSPEGKGQNPNIGFRKVAIRLTGSGKINLTVKLAEFASDVPRASISQWNTQSMKPAAESENYRFKIKVYNTVYDSLARIPVLDEDNLPDFEIIPEDAGMTAEVKKSDSITQPNVIKIYNKDKSKAKVNMIMFDTAYGIKDLVYDELAVETFEVGSEPESANIGANMFDGDMSTRWTTFTQGDSAVLDLGKKCRIDAVGAGFWQSGVRVYDIEVEVSDDKSNWRSVGKYKSARTEEDYQVFKFPTTDARYVRVIGNGSSVNVNTNILELRPLIMKEAYRNGK